MQPDSLTKHLKSLPRSGLCCQLQHPPRQLLASVLPQSKQAGLRWSYPLLVVPRRQCNWRTERQGQKFNILYSEEMEGEQETKCKNLCEMKQLLHLSKAQELLGRNVPRFPPDCSRVISWWIHMVTMGFDLKNERCTLPFPSPFQLHQCLPFPLSSQSSIALMS